MTTKKHLTVADIGRPTSIAGWPTNDLDGLFDALSRWPLEPRMSGADSVPWPPQVNLGPFVCFAWCACVKTGWNDGTFSYRGTRPLYPDHPEARNYFGNFCGYSFGWNVVTDDPDLIARLDAAIAANMARPDYLEAVEAERRRKDFWAKREAKLLAKRFRSATRTV